MSCRLCSVAPCTDELAAGVGGRRTAGSGIDLRPERYAPVSESGWSSRSCTVPETTTWPPCSPAPGPMSTAQSARPDGVLVVLDDDQGVAEVLEPDQGLDQPVVVALVQPDGRLVEDVEHADEAGADLGGEPDPLRLAAGQRARGPVEREVVQADVEQEPQPLVDLLEHPLGDLLLAGRQLEVAGGTRPPRRSAGRRSRRCSCRRA